MGGCDDWIGSSDSLCLMERIAGWMLLMVATGGFYWAFKLLIDSPGSLVGILLFIPVGFAAVVGVNLVGSQKEGE